MKKETLLDKSNKTPGFWFCAGLLAALLASILARDIDRPFYGLHSWGEAGCALKARNYLRYDIEYTKGFAVWSVGDPPRENPNRSLDHPQLGRFLPAVEMAIFGVNEKGLRTGGIIKAILSLLIFLKILHGLVDEKTALLAGFLYALFPITGYFGTGLCDELGWEYLFSMLAIWCYLVLISALKEDIEPQKPVIKSAATKTTSQPYCSRALLITGVFIMGSNKARMNPIISNQYNSSIKII